MQRALPTAPRSGAVGSELEDNLCPDMTEAESKLFRDRVGILKKNWGLVPISFAASLAGVSRTRVDQLVAAGIIQQRDFLGWKLVSVASLSRWRLRKATRKRRCKVSQMRLPLLRKDKAMLL